MLNVYICEDDKVQLKMLKNRINDIILICNYNMKIALATTNPYEIIEHVKNSFMNGLYYIDIGLNCEIDGFALAKHIREHDKRAFIVFVTANTTDYKLALNCQCEALDYIVKEIDFKRDSEMSYRIAHTLYLADKRAYINKIENDMTKYGNIFLEISKHKYILKDLNDIVYIQKNKVNNHKLDIYGSVIIHTNGTLKEILERLDDRFIQVGKSLIINKKKVYKYDKKKRLITLTIEGNFVSLEVSYQAMRNFLKIMYTKNDKNIIAKIHNNSANLS